MGVEPQEARSLPRNRKCGNCRFYEPAPLWRKGWCRNTKLYPPHANHLVDSTTIDCEGGFRSRIYWEPVPVPEVVETAPLEEFKPAPRPVTRTSHFNQVQDTRPAAPAPAVSSPTENAPAPAPDHSPDQPGATLAAPVEEVALPAGIGPGKDWRAFVRQRAPFTQAWPLEKIEFNRSTTPLWGVAGCLLLGLVVVVVSGLFRSAQPSTATPPVVGALQTASAQATVTARVVRVSSAATQATALAQPSPTPVVRQAVVKGTGATPLNIRETPSVKGKLIATVNEGEKVTVLEGPKDNDGRGWYRVEANGKSGWAAKDYLELQK